MTLPILYSFRRCPYAIRARLALKHCGAQYVLREVALKDKPAHMLEVSRVAHSPSVSDSYRVIDESIDIMHWAMNENHSRNIKNANDWLASETMSGDEINALIEQNDFEFKGYLDKYKYSDRHPEYPKAYYLEQAMPFLKFLEVALSNSPYLGGSQFRFADAAILPFIRQFSMVDPKQFNALALPELKQWLAQGLASDLFVSVMQKVPQWKPEPGEDTIN